MKRAVLAFGLLTALAVAGAVLAENARTQEAAFAAPAVININDHVVGFYVGRGLTAPSPVASIKGNWVDGGAWDLGAINYAVYKGDRAIVYDTSTLPQLGQWERSYLAKTKGIKHFTVVLSHWHLDHIAGNPSYADSDIISLDTSREYMVENKAAIEAGKLWGPPAMKVVLPNVTVKDSLDLYLGGLKVEFRRFNIHSKDGFVMYVPSDKALYVGDTLEDTVTYMVEPGDIPTHIAELKRMRWMAFTKIYPNHGDPDVIKHGGYTKTFVDAVAEYDVNMVKKAHDPGYLTMPIEEFIPKALAKHAVSVFEPYRVVHTNNLKLVQDYWKGKKLPAVG